MKKFIVMFVAVLGAAVVMTGCNKEKTDKEKIEDAKDKVEQKLSEAGEATKEAAKSAGKEIEKTADKVGNNIKDASKELTK